MRLILLALLLLPVASVAGDVPGAGGTSGMFESGLPLAGGTLGDGAEICFADPAGAQTVCIDSPAAGDFRTRGVGGSNNEDWTCDYETTANTIACTTSTGVTSYTMPSTVTLSVGELAVSATGRLFLDGGGNTYISETASDVLRFYVNTKNQFTLTNTDIQVSDDFVIANGLVYSGKEAVADSDITTDNTMKTIAYTSLTAPRTVTIRDADCDGGRNFTVRDEAGAAGTHNITLDPSGVSSTINGAATWAITSDYDSVSIECGVDTSGATEWFIK